jgi:hypothetical protein
MADWNDVEAAAIVAVDRNETVILSQSATELEYTFEIMSILDQHGKLIAQRDPGDVGATKPIPIRLRCEFELAGDAARSSAILDQARRRLSDLAGVDVRPLR